MKSYHYFCEFGFPVLFLTCQPTVRRLQRDDTRIETESCCPKASREGQWRECKQLELLWKIKVKLVYSVFVALNGRLRCLVCLLRHTSLQPYTSRNEKDDWKGTRKMRLWITTDTISFSIYTKVLNTDGCTCVYVSEILASGAIIRETLDYDSSL